MCAVVGMGIITVANIFKLRLTSLFGYIVTATAITYNLLEVYTMIEMLTWSSLAITGVSAIVIGSVIERHGVAIKLRFDNLIKKSEARIS